MYSCSGDHAASYTVAVSPGVKPQLTSQCRDKNRAAVSPVLHVPSLRAK